MADTRLADYPARLGDKQLVVVDHTGPASYTAGGETIGTSGSLIGTTVQGLSAIDAIVGSGYLSNSGNYQIAAQSTGVGLRKTQKLVWFPVGALETVPGVPLSLGTLSAAGTNTTYTAAGLVTVLTTTPPPLNSFIVLSNGASGKGIFLGGVMVRVTGVVAGTSYTFNFGQGVALAFASATDTLKYQVVQASSVNTLQAQTLAAPITGVLATANLLTITQANSLVQGQFVYLNGPFKTASVYALGAIVQVASATATSWTANWQGTIIAQTSAEVGVASLLVTNGGVPVAAYPYQAGPVATITNSLAVAADATHTGLLTLTAAQADQPGMLLVVQGVGTNTQLNGTVATVITTSLTQALIKANGWGVIANTSAETAGYASVIVTGAPLGLGDVTPGTNLSGETVRIGYIGR